jgi:benzoylformate decarboxylase
MTAPTPATPRWTRDYLFDILRELGIRHLFGVPGTNEIPLIDGTSFPENQVTYIECLHENIAIGAAMGEARLTGLPGVLVVHVTPGIAHSIGNLFNAARSRVPLVILCCQQQNELVTQEPLLASNLVDLARQYTKWAHEVRAAEEIPLVLQRAFKEAMAPPNGPVFVAIPWEFTMRRIGEHDRVAGVTRISSHFTGDPAAIAQAAQQLAQANSPLLVLGDAAGYANAWPELQELAELLGAPVVQQTLSSLANFPNDDYHWQGELPGDQHLMQAVFADHDVAFLCGFGAQAQVTVFKQADGPLIPATVQQIYLTNNTWDIGKNFYGETAIFGDIKATLPLLNAHLRQQPVSGAAVRNDALRQLAAARRTDWLAYEAQGLGQPTEIWAVTVAAALRHEIEARGLAKQFVYVHEAISDPAPFQYLLPFGPDAAAPTSYYCVAGGSLGWSMPASLGTKLAGRGWQGIEPRLVINAVGDGSSLFYPQVWWTAAHRKLGVLYIITNNFEYHTLQIGLKQVVAAYEADPNYGWHPRSDNPEYLRLERPKIDFVALARAFGVGAGEVVERAHDVARAVQRGIEHVLTTGESFVLDVHVTPSTSPTVTTATTATRYTAQPRLNYARAAVPNLRDTAPARHANTQVIP